MQGRAGVYTRIRRAPGSKQGFRTVDGGGWDGD